MLHLHSQWDPIRIFFLSPSQPHDANLLFEYVEYPSGHFQVLEQATAIRYRMQLVQDRLGQIFTHEFEGAAQCQCLRQFSWDTIGNLEEDPFYCFVGDLIRGQVHHGQDEAEALLDVSVHPFTQQDAVNSAEGRGTSQATQ